MESKAPSRLHEVDVVVCIEHTAAGLWWRGFTAYSLHGCERSSLFPVPRKSCHLRNSPLDLLGRKWSEFDVMASELAHFCQTPALPPVAAEESEGTALCWKAGARLRLVDISVGNDSPKAKDIIIFTIMGDSDIAKGDKGEVLIEWSDGNTDMPCVCECVDKVHEKSMDGKLLTIIRMRPITGTN